MTDQGQKAGEQSNLVQTGRDTTVNNYYGLSVTDVVDLVQTVFDKNALKLAQQAQTIFDRRANEFVDELRQRFGGLPQESLNSFADPDMLKAVYNAQSEFAYSGNQDLKTVLFELLEKRSQVDSGLSKIVLSEAIATAAKLTERQRRALALCFLVRYTSPGDETSIEDVFRHYFEGGIVALGDGLPETRASYQHIEYVGAGNVSVLHLDFWPHVRSSLAYWFTAGFTAEECPEPLRKFLTDPKVICPALRDSARYQLASPQTERVLEAAGTEIDSAVLEEAARLGTMEVDAIKAEVLARVPDVERVAEFWSSSQLKQLTLTSVGLAIGHGYFMRLSGGESPLEIWIHE